MTSPTIHINWLGGKCPVQAEGTINGKPFYFRSRGDWWCIEIGFGKAGWKYEESYGNWPEAGYITDDEAMEFIRQAAIYYMEETQQDGQTYEQTKIA